MKIRVQFLKQKGKFKQNQEQKRGARCGNRSNIEACTGQMENQRLGPSIARKNTFFVSNFFDGYSSYRSPLHRSLLWFPQPLISFHRSLRSLLILPSKGHHPILVPGCQLVSKTDLFPKQDCFCNTLLPMTVWILRCSLYSQAPLFYDWSAIPLLLSPS